MTDRNPEFDPADIRGTARSDPKLDGERDDRADRFERGSLPGTYPTDERGETTSTCATCWQDVPPGQFQCPHCVTKGISESSADADNTESDQDSWSFGRVVIAVVPAISSHHARALGRAAFAVGDPVASGPDISHAEVMLRSAFRTPPASHLTAGWPPLPDAVPVDTLEGRELLETAGEHTDWTAAEPDSAIFVETGQGLTDIDEFDTLQSTVAAADDEYWVVPGVVKRYSAAADPDSIVQLLHCHACSTATGHDHVGHGGVVSHPYTGRPIWTCRNCGQPRFEPESDTDAESKSSHVVLPDGVTPEEAYGGHPEPHEIEFEKQLTAYRERQGNYPWQE